jgi:lipid-A-disaccharide synthase
MKPRQVMLIAGEPSGDLLGAELVRALRAELTAAETVYSPDLQPLWTGLEPRFFGAGGPQMKAAGVDLAFDMTQHSVIGLLDALKSYPKFRHLFRRLYQLALEEEPDAIICVDFAGFNRRFASAVKQYSRSRHDWFHAWQPKVIQYVSPQVWASRESRAFQMARDYDLLLSIFPFEQDWYARRVPEFRVEFVGHPILDRYARDTRESASPAATAVATPDDRVQILLLPGSRAGELRRHLPIILGAFELLQQSMPPLGALMVLPNHSIAEQAKSFRLPAELEIQVGGLRAALEQADLAIASTGTVTMECAYFGVPTVTLYKTFWLNYLIAKQLAKVNSLTMPNLLAQEEVFPEFIQHAATAGNIAQAALSLLQDEQRRKRIKAALEKVTQSLGGPGATRRAARAIAQLLGLRKAP